MATPCPGCQTAHYVTESPEAGYWYCSNCGRRGSGHPNSIDWWTEDPDSIWYTGDVEGDEVRPSDGGST